MKYVIDASVGGKSVLPEVHSDKAIRLLDEYRQAIHELIAPDFYPVEVAHAITRAERQGRLTPAQGTAGLRDILTLLPRLEAALPLLPRAYAISSSFRTGVYDCIYIALAEREQCQLITADARLGSLQSTFPFIAELASLP
jgi:predicted nucleic acid-binding protein